MWDKLAKTGLIYLLAAFSHSGCAQEPPVDKQPPAAPIPNTEPHYDDTFSGPVVEISAERITVSRSVLGKPAEKKSFWIKPDTRVEGAGKLRAKVKVTVGFVTTDEGDIARLIVVRQDKKK